MLLKMKSILNYWPRHKKPNVMQILIPSIFYNIQKMEHKYARASLQDKRKKIIQQKITQQLEVLQLIDELKARGSLKKQAFTNILRQSSNILQNQPNVLKLRSPLVVVGDIHGQFYDLLYILQKGGSFSKNVFLFMGDYVDRGKFCIEVLTLLLKLKIAYPNNIFLLRGNHEDRTMTTHFNFKLQCEKKYNSEVYQSILDCFKKMPICAHVDEKYFVVHAGISPQLTYISEIDQINRFVQVNTSTLLGDMLWSDPSDVETASYTENKSRCCSYFFSPVQSLKFLSDNKLSLIIRGHQVNTKGFKYQYSSNKTPLTLTVFSAPNYCDTYGNKGAIAVIKDSSIELKSFKQSDHPVILQNYMNAFQLSFSILAAETTKIFKHMLKFSEGKRRYRRESRQYAEVVKNVQELEDNLHKQSNQLVDFVLGHANGKKLQINDDQLGAELREELLKKFLQMKQKDQGQKFPFIFGPKKIQFFKILLHSKELNQIQIEDQFFE